MGLASKINLIVQHSRIVTASVTANWNTGTATSGLAGADVVTIGAVNQWWRLSDAYFVVSGFNALADIDLRAYWTVAGTERLMLSGTWSASDSVAWLMWYFNTGGQEILGPLRFECHSDQLADNGLTTTYEYRIKNW